MSKEARCPYCLDALVGEEPVVRCVLCRTPHHEPCFNENGGCVAFGCGSVIAGAAGQSILVRRATLELGQPWVDSPLAPLDDAIARYRPAKRLENERSARPPHASVRLSIERTALYPGQDLRARVVVAVPRDTVLRRLELHVYEEPRGGATSPRRLFRATLLGRPPLTMRSLFRSMGALTRRAPRLELGLHPFDVEVPGFYGRVIMAGTTVQTTVGIVLERKDLPPLFSPQIGIEPAWATAALANPGQAIVARPPNVRDAGLPAPPAPTLRDELRELPPGPRGAAPVAQPVGPPGGPVEDSEFDDAPTDLWGSPRSPHHGGAWAQMGRSSGEPLAPPPIAAPIAPPPRPPGDDSDALIAAPRPERPDTLPVPQAAPPPAAPSRRIIVRKREFLEVVPLAADGAEPVLPAASEVLPRPSLEVGNALEIGDDRLPPAPRPGSPEPLGRPLEGLPAPPRPMTPAPTAGGAGWTVLPFHTGGLAGTPTGRLARARFEPRRELPPLRLSLEVRLSPGLTDKLADNGAESTVEVLVDSPSPLRTLELACRYELAAAEMTDVSLGGFPLTEEIALVSEEALAPARTGRDETIRVLVPLDAALVEGARTLLETTGAASPELVVRFAVDGSAWEGSIVGSGTRVVRVPLGKPNLSDEGSHATL